MTYIDRLNSFFRHLVYNDLPPHAQLLYLHLLNVANQLQWQEKFCITDRRLETLTGLSSKAISDAKRILKGRFVTINTNKKNPRQGSCYSLHSIESKPSTSPSISLSKIKEEEEETDGARARVCGAGATFGKLSAEIIAAWGDGLNWNDAYDLRALEERQGVDAVVKAINAAKNSLNGEPLTINYLRGTLRRMKERAEKGDVSNVRDNRNDQSERPPSQHRRNYDRAFGFDDED